MQYYVFSLWSEGAGIALRLQEEGNDVTFAMIHDLEDTRTSKEKGGKPEDPKEKEGRLTALDGMIQKREAWKAISELKSIPQAKRKDVFIFFDSNVCWKFAEALAGQGFNGNFPTEQDRIMEVDRELSKEFVKKHYPDLEVADVEEFKKIEEAADLLENTDDVWVIKGGDVDSETFVPESEDPDIARKEVMNQLVAGKALYEKAGFILERKIKNCIELTPQIVFYNGIPIYATVCIELKRKYAGNLGKMVGCSGDLVFEVPLDCKIMEMAIPEVVYEMARSHEGMFIWDASLLFDPETLEAYFGEFCPNRVGWNCFYTEISLAKSVTHYFESLVAKKNPFENKKQYSVSTRIFNEELDDGYPKGDVCIYGLENADNVWPFFVKLDDNKNETVTCAAAMADSITVTGTGESIELATDEAFRDVKHIVMKKMMYRPKSDFLSREYRGNIMSRYEFGVEHKLFPRNGNKRTISLDFDHTIYDTPSDEELGGSEPLSGNPTKGAMEFIKRLQKENLDVRILTARPDIERVRDWLLYQGFNIPASSVKMPSIAYVDDRAIEFDGDWEEVYAKINALRR